MPKTATLKSVLAQACVQPGQDGKYKLSLKGSTYATMRIHDVMTVSNRIINRDKETDFRPASPICSDMPSHIKLVCNDGRETWLGSYAEFDKAVRDAEDVLNFITLQLQSVLFDLYKNPLAMIRSNDVYAKRKDPDISFYMNKGKESNDSFYLFDGYVLRYSITMSISGIGIVPAALLLYSEYYKHVEKWDGNAEKVLKEDIYRMLESFVAPPVSCQITNSP